MILKTIKYPEKSAWKQLLQRPVKKTEDIEKEVAPVLEAVKKLGDMALREFTRKFDKAEVEELEVTESEIFEAEKSISPELKAALLTAKSNIEAFHLSQKNEAEPVETTPGVLCWRKSIPIQKVGFYIPGGTAPLFSTILMLAVPARIAGCGEIVLCTPPDKQGKIHPAILFAARLCGISKIFKVGGSQAIAAMAYGTETVPQVYKIFGPGNQYVTAAKQLINKEGVAIDMPAGPSEVAVVADRTANPAFVAADLLSQAEHGADSQVLLVTTDEELIQKVGGELEKQLKTLPRMAFAEKALENSKSILLYSENEVMELINDYAPEHLIVATANPDSIAAKVVNAGSVFLGHFTPEAAGDYASGTNHTLPTNGFARAYSGVSLDSFYKKVTFQSITKEGLARLGPVIETMAENEMLLAHKNAVTLRLEAL